MNDINLNWADLKKFRSNLMAIMKLLVLIVCIDLVLSILLSFVLGNTHYFDAFLEDVEYEQIINDYYGNDFFVEPHEEVGWVNKPNFVEPGLEWKTSHQGSRIAIDKGFDSEDLSTLGAVFLLGSSAMNGYSLPHDKTPVGYLQHHHGRQAFDFGTIMYSVDQSFFLYKNQLAQYKPDVIVVGLHNKPKAISNLFAPFRGGNVSSPFIKPAYYLTGNTLKKVQPPVAHHKNQRYDLLLQHLAEHDAYYYKFLLFKRLSLLPFSDLLRRTILFLQEEFLGVSDYKKSVGLQAYFMEALTTLAEQNGTQVIFLKFESLSDVKKPLYKRWYRDKNTLHNEMLKGTSMNVLVLSDILAETGSPTESFYLPGDDVHLNETANKLIAEKVNELIKP